MTSNRFTHPLVPSEQLLDSRFRGNERTGNWFEANGMCAGAETRAHHCLGVTIGGTELVFQIPTAALSEVAHTLLMVGDAKPPRLS